MTRLYGLDALRGIAAIFVMLFHAHEMIGGFDAFRYGFLAVDFFFVLSGFVMARSYEHRMEFRPFIKTRYVRLIKTMAPGFAVGFIAFALIQGDIYIWPLVAAFMFLPTFSDGMVPFILNRPAWSIFFEFAANLAHAAIFRHCSVALLTSLSFLSLIFLAIGSARYGLQMVGPRANGFLFGFGRVFASYCLGIIIWRLTKSTMRCPVWLPAIAFIAALIAMASADANMVAQLAFVVIACPIFVLAARGEVIRGTGVCQFLGDISFPLYAIHYPILQATNWLGGSSALAAIISLAGATCWPLVELIIRARRRNSFLPSSVPIRK